jgi:outer membrane receptor protein involved in Fe transport
VIGIVGNPGYKAEAFHDVEGGYRLQIGSGGVGRRHDISGRYTGLPTSDPLPPAFEATPDPPHIFVATRLENRLRADTAGVELAARVTPAPGWRIDGSYSTFRLTAHLDSRQPGRRRRRVRRPRARAPVAGAFERRRGPADTD